MAGVSQSLAVPFVDLAPLASVVEHFTGDSFEGIASLDCVFRCLWLFSVLGFLGVVSCFGVAVFSRDVLLFRSISFLRIGLRGDFRGRRQGGRNLKGHVL